MGLSGRERSVHEILGGGIIADVVLWRRRDLSIGMVLGMLAAWLIFERSGYTLLSFVSNVLLLLISILFTWAKAATILNRLPPPIPEMHLTEEVMNEAAVLMRSHVNMVLLAFHDIALGRDSKLFYRVAMSLWLISIIGSLSDFLTLVYTSLVIILTIPMLYEKYEDFIDRYMKLAYMELQCTKEHMPSIFRRYTASLVPRSVYTSGKSLSAAGLTATAAKEPERDCEFCIEYNVALPPAILSRFDLVYVMIDEPDENTDYHIAHHIVRVHQKREDALAPAFTTAELKRYITYAKSLKLQLSSEAKKVLVESYVTLRRGDSTPGTRVAYRMTVRQLEALIRLSEAIARCHLEKVVLPAHVRMAVRLLKTSIISVESSEIDLSDFQDHEDGDGNRASDQAAAEPASGNVDPVPENEGNEQGAESQQKKKLVITEDHFQRVTQALVMRLRQHEEAVMQDGMRNSIAMYEEAVMQDGMKRQ